MKSVKVDCERTSRIVTSEEEGYEMRYEYYIMFGEKKAEISEEQYEKVNGWIEEKERREMVGLQRKKRFFV